MTLVSDVSTGVISHDQYHAFKVILTFSELHEDFLELFTKEAFVKCILIFLKSVG